MVESQTLESSECYRSLYRIRCFEEKVLRNFTKGFFFGTTHTYIGQEANAVGVLSHIDQDDIVFSNHRCHGHFLAYGGDMRSLFAELMGKETGVCAGRGGSQHLHWINFYSNGVQGGIVPIATGMALAEKFKQGNTVTIAFLGDGTLGEGVVYEALNMASLWQAPILFVVENNRIAQTTPVELSLAGDMSKRFEAFDIPSLELDTSDVNEILAAAGELIRDIRNEQSPTALILHTHRFAPHSKGDDTRNPDEVSKIMELRDPIIIQATRLSENEHLAINEQVESETEYAFQQALSDPLPIFDKMHESPD